MQKKGNRGLTTLLGNIEISKSSRIIEAIGDIDELNCLLGLIRSIIKEKSNNALPSSISTENKLEVLDTTLKTIQEHLFLIGSDLAGIKQKSYKDKLLMEQVRFVEEHNKKFRERVEAGYRNHRRVDSKEETGGFTVPGESGNTIEAYIHLARAVARRAERHSVKVAEKNKLNPKILRYLNQLSNLLFTLSKFISI